LTVGNRAEVNVQNKAGKTPLYEAVRSYRGVEATQCLLSHGADPEISHNLGNTPPTTYVKHFFIKSIINEKTDFI